MQTEETMKKILQLQDSIEVEVIEGQNLPWIPSWYPKPGSILIAQHRNTEEYEREFIQTIGSGNGLYLEGEEFRFAKDSLLLQSIFFEPSEENMESNELVKRWLNLKSVKGTLRLVSPQSFRCEPDDYRWMSSDGKLLAAIQDVDWIESSDKFRLRVAQDFDLLFVEQKWCGWMLSNPARYLIEPNSPADSDSELNSLAFEYVSLVSEPYIEQMDDKDPEILERLIGLRNKINLKDGAVEHRRLIYDCLGEVIENFYGTAALNR